MSHDLPCYSSNIVGPELGTVSGSGVQQKRHCSCPGSTYPQGVALTHDRNNYLIVNCD